jgi:DNA-nicking Smr family endonuclease
MSAKKKTSKKPTKPKRTARRKATPAKAQKPRKKVAKKKAAAKREEKRKVAAAKRFRNQSKRMGEPAVPPERRGSCSGEQSGDLQGLSRLEAADSESVDELIAEGNAFEADVVAGVESAGDADDKEVRTHEVPEDDVPEEYLDKE